MLRPCSKKMSKWLVENIAYRATVDHTAVEPGVSMTDVYEFMEALERAGFAAKKYSIYHENCKASSGSPVFVTSCDFVENFMSQSDGTCSVCNETLFVHEVWTKQTWEVSPWLRNVCQKACKMDVCCSETRRLHKHLEMCQVQLEEAQQQIKEAQQQIKDYESRIAHFENTGPTQPGKKVKHTGTMEDYRGAYDYPMIAHLKRVTAEPMYKDHISLHRGFLPVIARTGIPLPGVLGLLEFSPFFEEALKFLPEACTAEDVHATFYYMQELLCPRYPVVASEHDAALKADTDKDTPEPTGTIPDDCITEAPVQESVPDRQQDTDCPAEESSNASSPTAETPSSKPIFPSWDVDITMLKKTEGGRSVLTPPNFPCVLRVGNLNYSCQVRDPLFPNGFTKSTRIKALVGSSDWHPGLPFELRQGNQIIGRGVFRKSVKS